jgi:hypothetical protein
MNSKRMLRTCSTHRREEKRREEKRREDYMFASLT